MTALKEFARLETDGIWFCEPGAEPRPVTISFGEATLVAIIGLVGFVALLFYYQWIIALIVVLLSLINVVILQVVLSRRRSAQSLVTHAQNNLRQLVYLICCHSSWMLMWAEQRSSLVGKA